MTPTLWFVFTLQVSFAAPYQSNVHGLLTQTTFGAWLLSGGVFGNVYTATTMTVLIRTS